MLNIPLDCTLGDNCYINDYFDRDTSEGTRDYACGDVTRDNHRGVDFALQTLQQMRDGVNVIAAAPGTVRGIRDGMPDIANTDPNAPDLTGRECGNGVAIDHGGGWSTQYCHLKQGSVTVKNGDRVRLGTVLGDVGLSGQTNYPHVHFSTFKDRKRVDPFNPDMVDTCRIGPDEGLWQKPPAYQPSGLVRIGLTGTSPKLADIRDGLPSTPNISADADALIAWAQGYSVQEGDTIKTSIEGPNGPFWSGEATVQRDRKFALQFMGRKRRNTLWTTGAYTATMTLMRDGQAIETDVVTTQVVAPTAQ
ncbi:MAG: M23 family metallopeptidase [Planktomarina sp.]